MDAAAPGPVDILAASPAGAQAAIFANKLEAALKRGLPEAVSTEDTNSGNQADTLAFLQGDRVYPSHPFLRSQGLVSGQAPIPDGCSNV